MTLQIQVKSKWFLLTDKWHRETVFHYIEANSSRSICGSIEITPVNSEFMLELDTIQNVLLRDICKKCLRKMI